MAARRSNAEIRAANKQHEMNQRRTKVLEMHLAGMTSRAIAKEVGVSHVTVMEDVTAAMASYNLNDPNTIQTWRATQLADLEMMRNALAPSVEKPPTVPILDGKGNLITDAEGKEVRMPLYKEQFMATDRMIKLHERLSRLLGLDMPEQQTVDNHVTIEIVKSVGGVIQADNSTEVIEVSNEDTASLRLQQGWASPIRHLHRNLPRIDGRTWQRQDKYRCVQSGGIRD